MTTMPRSRLGALPRPTPSRLTGSRLRRPTPLPRLPEHGGFSVYLRRLAWLFSAR
jgi:hypothetical protein